MVGGELTASRTPTHTHDSSAGGTQARLGLRDSGLLGWAASGPKTRGVLPFHPHQSPHRCHSLMATQGLSCLVLPPPLPSLSSSLPANLLELLTLTSPPEYPKLRQSSLNN